MSFFDEDDEPTRPRPPSASPPTCSARPGAPASTSRPSGSAAASRSAAACCLLILLVAARQRLPGLAPQERAARLEPRGDALVHAVRRTRSAASSSRRCARRQPVARGPADRRSPACASRRRRSSSGARSSTRRTSSRRAAQSLLDRARAAPRRPGLHRRADQHRARQRGRRRRPGDRGHRRPDAGVPGLRRARPLARDAGGRARRSRTTTSWRTRSTTKGFLPGLAWLEPAYVADQLGTRLSERRQRPPVQRRAPAPGLHGTGLRVVDGRRRDAAAGPGANRVPARRRPRTSPSRSPTRARTTSSTSRSSSTLDGGRASRSRRARRSTPSSGRHGDGRTSRCPRKPTAGEVYTVKVEVKPVPGEKKTDNNTRPTTSVPSRRPRPRRRRASLRGRMSEFSDAPGVVALAAAGVAVVGAAVGRRARRRGCAGCARRSARCSATGATDLVAHAAGAARGVRRAAAPHVERRRRAPRASAWTAAEHRLDGAIAYRVARPLRRLRRAVGPPVDDDRAARRRAQRRRAVARSPTATRRGCTASR